MSLQSLLEGNRVQVKTRFFEGRATILYIAPGEFYPIQVEMDTPDSDGHKIQRVALHEVLTELPAEKEYPAVTFDSPGDQQRYVGEVIWEGTSSICKKGEQFILGVVSYPGVFKAGPAKSFYLYDPESLKFSGCMPASMFRIIEPYATVSVVQETLRMEKKSVKALEKPEEVTIMPEELKYQQMSLMDFV